MEGVTAAAFAKGLLNLHAHLIPILTSLVYKNKYIKSMLDDGAQSKNSTQEVKDRLYQLMQNYSIYISASEKKPESSSENPELSTPSVDSTFFSQNNPTEAISVTESLREFGNPQKALEELYKAMVNLVQRARSF